MNLKQKDIKMAVENRNAPVSFVLTPSEKVKLQKACDKKEMRMSDYIREAITKQVSKDLK